MPQSPQLFVSLSKLTHRGTPLASQVLFGDLQSTPLMMLWQVPFWQVCPGWHEVAQFPQCLSSTLGSMQVPPQFSLSRAQSGAAQDPLALQMLPVGQLAQEAPQKRGDQFLGQ